MSVLFTDIVGSTELVGSVDPEVLRPVLGDYFAACRAAIAHHGGTVEKFIGDAVMAVFGVPDIHEDDALRAVRAAVELHAAVGALAASAQDALDATLQVRTGVATGAVLVGGGRPGEPIATGDAVNTAARLQTAAAPGEIILSEATIRLVARSAEVERLPPLELKGKPEPVTAGRLIRLLTQEFGSELRFVGRHVEVEELERTWKEVRSTATPAAIAVIAEPGIGKTRLLTTFLSHREPGIRIGRAAVASYGEGSLGPLAALLRSLASPRPGDPMGTVDLLGASLAGHPGDQELRTHLAALMRDGALRVEEAFWVTRVVIDALARDTPIILAVEDLHWAEPGLVALLGDLPGALTGRVLLIATSRPGEPSFPGTWTRVDIAPLDDAASWTVMEGVTGGPVDPSLARILTGLARGNPLFLEQIIATLRDDGRIRERGGTWSATGELTTLAVPATIEAIVAGRFDRLGRAEQDLLERIAIAGNETESWQVGGVPPGPGVVEGLVAAGFLAQPPAPDQLAYRHALVRDAVYGGLAKRRRAMLHAEFAARLEADSRDADADRDLRIGHHLEAAVRYRTEVRAPTSETAVLARSAATHLTFAGRRASAAGDMPAAASLLGRASVLLPEDDITRASLLPDLGKARLETGDPRAQATIAEAVERTAAAGLTREHAHARLAGYVSELWFDRSVTGPAEREPITALAGDMEASGDLRGAALAWAAVAEVDWFTGSVDAAIAATETAARLAREAGDLWAWREYLALSAGDVWGHGPVDSTIDRVRGILRASDDHPVVAARALPVLGTAIAQSGDPTTGRAMVWRGLELAHEVGLRVWEMEMAGAAAWYEAVLGDPAAGLAPATRACDIALDLGDRSHLAFVGAVRAMVHAALGDDQEAMDWAARAHANRPSDASPTELVWMTALVPVHLRAGRADEAAALAARAAGIAWDDGWSRAEAEAAQARVLGAQGRADEAATLHAAAFERYTRLGYATAAHRLAAGVSAT